MKTCVREKFLFRDPDILLRERWEFHRTVQPFPELPTHVLPGHLHASWASSVCTQALPSAWTMHLLPQRLRDAFLFLTSHSRLPSASLGKLSLSPSLIQNLSPSGKKTRSGEMSHGRNSRGPADFRGQHVSAEKVTTQRPDWKWTLSGDFQFAFYGLSVGLLKVGWQGKGRKGLEVVEFCASPSPCDAGSEFTLFLNSYFEDLWNNLQGKRKTCSTFIKWWY